MKRIALTALALALTASTAAAQQPARKDRPTPVAAEKKVKTLDIEAIDVSGDRVTGTLGPISVNEAAKSSSLIRIRRDFIDLILKSADDM